jgi:ubiquinone/menaquinone biosynthesis C-methylase UbiE
MAAILQMTSDNPSAKRHYEEGFDTLQRFISYFYQIDLTKRLNPETVVEIGVGNKTVVNYLREHGFDVTTCDISKDLQPDCVADIRGLPFPDSSFDVALAFQILEHLPWNDVELAMKELHRISKKNVIVSIPYRQTCFELVFRLPSIGRVAKRLFIDFFVGMPSFFRRVDPAGEHRWEMGLKEYPRRKVRKVFERKFTIIGEIRPVLNSYHHFFILEKR